MFVGSLAAVVHGCGFPIMMLVFGRMLDQFLDTGQLCDICSNLTDVIADFNSQQNDSDFTCDTFLSSSPEDLVITECVTPTDSIQYIA